MRFARAAAGWAVDASAMGAVGGLLYWAMWGGRLSDIVIFGAIAGPLTALLLRWRRRQTTGDIVVSRLLRR